MEIKKRYYEIDDVARAINRPASTIRFWESKLPWMAPKVRGANNKRKYQGHEMVRVVKVSYLIDFGMTVKGIANAYEKGYFDELCTVLNQFTEEL